MYLDTSEKLTEFVTGVKSSKVLAVDTEFIRERRYYPQLCLIQMATEDTCAIIDPLALSDLSPVVLLFEDPTITKVFHAGDQDCAIIYTALGVIPEPIFDTQYAAHLLGASQKIGLAHLVRRYCNVGLDKSNAFTDWLKRPLSKRQIEYALDDVRYLPRVYSLMVKELEELGRLSWLKEEFERVYNKANYADDPNKVWQKVKHLQSMPPRQLAIVRAIALWRENIARKKDYPRNWILTDDQLVEIVKRDPQSIAELFEIRGIQDKLGERWAQELFSEIKGARSIPENQWPRREGGVSLRVEHKARLDLMTALVHLRASENQIATAILAPRDELTRLAGGELKGLDVLTGWRREMVGAELLDLLSGRLSLHLDDNTLIVSKIDDPKVTKSSQNPIEEFFSPEYVSMDTGNC